MKKVQPIRNHEVLRAIKDYLRETNGRNFVLFSLGINTGFRISDILPLRVGDVKGTHINIIEEKTGKQKSMMINPTLRYDLTPYIYGKEDHECLFPSRSKKRTSGLKGRPVSRSMAYKMLNVVAHRFGLKEIGTHTLRKTFGYHYYLKKRDVALLMELFNHSSQAVTLAYIGINQDVMDAQMKDFGL